MADKSKAGESKLDKVFNSAAHHFFSWGTLFHAFLMMGMVLAPMGAAVAAAGHTATAGDLAVGTLDMFWKMITGFFTDGNVLVDAFGNAVQGNFAPTIDPSAALASHGTSHAAHAAGEAAGCTADQLSDIFGGMSAEDFAYTKDMAGQYAGGDLNKYFSQSHLCHG